MVLGGVLASRGHIQLWLLIVIVVVAAVTGPLVGYEIGRRMGDRLFAAPAAVAASPAGWTGPGPCSATGAASACCSAGSWPSCGR